MSMPNKLKVSGGRLEMIDGSDPTDYLLASRIPDGSDVVVMKRDDAERMARDAHSYRMLMDARFALAA